MSYGLEHPFCYRYDICYQRTTFPQKKADIIRHLTLIIHAYIPVGYFCPNGFEEISCTIPQVNRGSPAKVISLPGLNPG